MKNYVLVKDGEVINRAIFDDQMPSDWPDKEGWQESEIAQIGWTKTGEILKEPDAPPPPLPVIPQSISDRQFFQQLANLKIITDEEALAAVGPGIIPAALAALVDGLPTDQQFPARMLLTGATQFQRNHPLVDTVRMAYGWSDAQLDDLWMAAAQL